MLKAISVDRRGFTSTKYTPKSEPLLKPLHPDMEFHEEAQDSNPFFRLLAWSLRDFVRPTTLSDI